jgi:two-component system, OmpR family, sensor histidine kinase KdpD
MTFQRLSMKALLPLSLPVITPLIATGLTLLIKPWVAVANLALLYLLAVVVTAVNTRMKPALACAVLSFLAYNFFLTEPHFSLEMLHREDALTAFLLIAVALITGQLAARLSEQVAALRASEQWNLQQMACARALSGCVDGEQVIEVFAEQLQEALGWFARRIAPPTSPPGPADARSVIWTEDEAGATVIFVDGSGRPQSAIRVSATERMTPWHRERLDVLVNLALLAWSRVNLADSLRQETLDREREQLRSALLSSVSHDLRTPLATMIGSVSSLIDLKDALDEDARSELLANTLSEARRLDRYIQKLLDMTRLGHGELPLDRDWVGVDDIVSVVARRLRPLQGTLRLEVEVPPNLPLLHVHPALIEQALFNVLENAVRFSPEGGAIRLGAGVEDKQLNFDVADNGPGISPEDQERVFDMFHTFSHGDAYAAGTGLGLAICRSILGAHGGRVAVLHSAPGKGTTIRLSLPLPVTDELPMEED